MSTGHVHSAYPQPEPKHYEMLKGLEREPWFQMARKRPFRLLTSTDCPYVAGSTTDFGEPDWDDWPAIIVDRHAYPVVRKKRLLPSNIEHELVEAILLAHGWSYVDDPERPAHLVASAAENVLNMRLYGITPEESRKVYEPLIKADAREKLKIIHIALNLKPYLDKDDFDKRLLIHMQAVMTGMSDQGLVKLPPDAVDYSPSIAREDGRKRPNADHDDRCGNCAWFTKGRPNVCERVAVTPEADYWCRVHLDADDAEEYEAKEY